MKMAAVPMCLRFSRSARLMALRSPSSWQMRSLIPSSSQTEEAEGKQATASNVAGQDGIPSAELEQKQKVQSLNAEKETLLGRISEIDDKYKRALAENENIRQRMQRQIQDAKLFGIQSFCKDLLDVADILQKATESIPADELTDENPYLKSLYDGLTMTETQLQKVFQRHGLAQINPVDEKFDPNQHEALFQQVVEGKTPGTVAVVTKIGYKLHERTIRPALVGVVKSTE